MDSASSSESLNSLSNGVHFECRPDGDTVLPSVRQYYTGKNVFITGATGFIGKVLMEKIMRCCPEVNKLYIMMRAKKGQAVEERLDTMCQCKVFDRLRTEQPEFRDKLGIIVGDMLEDGLGISAEEVALLEREVHIVMHSAATIRFDEPLRLAVQLNVLGVRKMVELAKNFKQLEVFVHVSTAYANCDRKRIEEVFYPPAVNYQHIINALDWLSDPILEKLTPEIIGEKPNTYTFTKHLAEALLLREGAGLPLTVVRPSIVTASWREPEPGWIDNLNGPSGLYVATGKGLLKTMKADGTAVADIIPVDFPVNAIVTAAWYTAVTKPTQCTFYQSTTGAVNPILWGQMGNLIRGFYHRVPLDTPFRRPGLTITSYSWVFDYWVFVSHMIPAYLSDMGLRCVGKKPRMVKLYNRLHKAISTLDFFTCRQWHWTNNNIMDLAAHLSPEDRKTYVLDPRTIHWPDYLENYCLGTKKFLLKEDLAKVPAARAHLRKLRNIRYTFNTAILVLLWRVLIARSQLARNLWYFIVRLTSRFVSYFRITSTISPRP